MGVDMVFMQLVHGKFMTVYYGFRWFGDGGGERGKWRETLIPATHIHIHKYRCGKNRKMEKSSWLL